MPWPTNEATIVGFRVLQGVGGALISANSGAVIADTFPAQRRGRAYGYTSVGLERRRRAGHPARRAHHHVRLVALDLRHQRAHRHRRHLSWPCACCATAASVTAHRVDVAGMVAPRRRALLRAVGHHSPGHQPGRTPTLLGYLVAGVVLLVAFVAVERRQAEPMLDLSLFHVPTMSPTLFAALLQSLANFATLFLVTMYLQGVRQLTPLHAALVLVPGYLVGAFVGPLAGRLADRLGAVYPATVGLAIQCVALLIYAQLGLTTPLWVVIVAAIINGIGSGASSRPTTPRS